ncbi:MAG TPA: YjhG/YagF family D-xylonate dehydratase, partial [Gemmataceae bacterium]|nr:YjhG/YagF family D-xylonate dehydratase [Gemmataceae bacterium]
GKVRDGDRIQIVIDRNSLVGSVDLIGQRDRTFSPEDGKEILDRRSVRDDLAPDPALPDDTRLWAMLQNAGGGVWGGCVYDSQAIETALKANSVQPTLD